MGQLSGNRKERCHRKNQYHDPVELTQHILDSDQITDRAWITGY